MVTGLSNSGNAPWYVGSLLLPVILLGLNLYLVGGVSRTEKALQTQQEMLEKITALAVRVETLEKIETQQKNILDRVVVEQQNRAPRLALLESGLDRLGKGQERIEQQIASLKDLVRERALRPPSTAVP